MRFRFPFPFGKGPVRFSRPKRQARQGSKASWSFPQRAVPINDSSHGFPSARAAPAHLSEARHTLLASFLGWTLDAFDFFVLVFVVSAIASDFHRSVADIAFTITATLMMRPIGALIFGWLADRYGRRIPLMIDVVFYSVVEVMSGLAPSYATFLFLRALYGIGMGGEWGVGAALAMEAAPAPRAGCSRDCSRRATRSATCFAAAAYFFVFPLFGWRPLFFIGGLPALLTLYIRTKVPESQAWERARPESGAIWRAIRGNLASFVYLVVLMTMMNLVSHGTQDMYPTFLQRERGLEPRTVATIAVIYNIGALAGGLVFGYLSDRMGPAARDDHCGGRRRAGRAALDLSALAGLAHGAARS